MLGSTLAKRGWLLVLTAAACVYLYGLGRAPLVGADEPRYAQVAREMYARGDLVTPTLGGHTWFEKPALPYWTAAAAYRLFGVTELSARLGTAAAGLLTVLLLGALAGACERRAGGELRGLRVTVTGVAASCAGLLVFSRALNFDSFITLAVTGALTCFYLAEMTAEEKARRWCRAGCYACVGAGLLSKGLLGVVLPAGVVALYYLLRRARPRGMKTLLWGVPLACAVAGLWYAPVTARHGWTFVDEFFVQHHFARYVSNKYHHPQPVYFYLPVMALLALPWTAFLVEALWAARRWRWRGDDAADGLRVLALAWLVVPVAFFSLSGSKLPGYVLPALPGALLLAGERVHAYLRGDGGRAAMRATGVLLLLSAAGAVGYAARTGALPLACAAVVAAPAFVLGVCALFAPERRRLCAWGTVGAALLTVCLVTMCALAPVARRESVRDLLRAAAARGYGATPVMGLHAVDRTAEFYAAGRLAYDARGEPFKVDGPGEVWEVARARGDVILVFVPLEVLYQLTQAPYLRTEVIGDNGTFALAAVRSN
ncbi:MAG TPA: glycosyltransferase family 39 protein [Pyrinomonadaceae bacterium]